MIEIHWRGGRPGADGPFYALLILGLGLLAGLLGFILHHSPAVAAAATDACISVVETASVVSSALLVPWTVVSIVVGFGLVTSLWQLVATRSLVRRLMASRVPTPPELRAAAEAVDVTALDLVEDEQPFAFCYGLLKPRVCLTTGLLDLLSPAELRAVLLHERHHQLSRDPLKILVSRSLSVGLFFLPAAHDLRDRFMVGKEMAADASAAETVQSELPLASALLKLLARGESGLPSSVAAIGAFNVTEERIQRMLRGGPVGQARLDARRLAATALVIAGIFAASYLPLAAASVSAAPEECGTVAQSVR